MKQALAALASVAILFGLLKLFQHWELSENALDAGTSIATFALPDLQGRHQRVPVAGRETLILYGASWCGPCLEELPILREFSRRNSANGAQLVMIMLEDERSSRPWLQANPQPFPMLLEAPGKADSSVRLGNAKGLLPYAVLVGADRRVRATRTGPFTDQADLQAWAASGR